MTKDEKELLLKDLGARLPYGVIIQVYYEETGYFNETVWSVDNAEPIHVDGWRIENIKPYLRPMSSMTVEEEYEYHQYKNINYLEICNQEHQGILKSTALVFSSAIDWLNSHHFDYRGLIEKGLALEAPDGMYKN